LIHYSGVHQRRFSCCASSLGGDSLMQAVTVGASLVGAFAAWVWWRQRTFEDDDDEVYFACFRPSASPVATPHAFVKILERLPPGSRVLDIGVGSGTYLEHDLVRKLLKERRLHVDGVDISVPNVAICKQRIEKHGLGDCFTAIVEDARELKGDGTYDALLFMESFPVMSKALFIDIYTKVQRLLKPAGQNYLYHNLVDPTKTGSLTLASARFLKPLLRVFVGIDFGRLTTIPEMWDCLDKAVPNIVPKSTFEVLLSCHSHEASVDFSGVSNPLFRFGCLVFKMVMMVANYHMEQHLIVTPKGM